ncbi:phage minor head protein [Phenylobacterium sp.]|uniref:phage minor head protein n=1 Tax=Phenylobacterium sp. TaxID=1871053 RepID=UPI00301C2E0C
MTNRNRTLHAWLYAMTRLETMLRAQDARARNALIRKIAQEYKKNGQTPNHVFAAHETRLAQMLADHYRRTIPVFSRMALGQVKSRRISRKEAQSIFEALTQEWIAREALRKAKLIADTDRDDIVKAISASVADGEGTAAIARAIRQVSSLTPFRASIVARTETHAAATFGSIESVREAERELGVVMQKEWLATRDARTRPEHMAADGQKVGLDEKFTVGGEAMDRPGDTNASAWNTVACRCALSYEEKV